MLWVVFIFESGCDDENDGVVAWQSWQNLNEKFILILCSYNNIKVRLDVKLISFSGYITYTYTVVIVAN